MFKVGDRVYRLGGQHGTIRLINDTKDIYLQLGAELGRTPTDVELTKRMEELNIFYIGLEYGDSEE